jgi:hypothetical protein
MTPWLLTWRLVIGRLVIGRLVIGRLVIGRLVIGRLVIGRLVILRRRLVTWFLVTRSRGARPAGGRLAASRRMAGFMPISQAMRRSPIPRCGGGIFPAGTCRMIARLTSSHWRHVFPGSRHPAAGMRRSGEAPGGVGDCPPTGDQ